MSVFQYRYAILLIFTIFVRLLIQYTEDKNNEEDRWKGYLYVGGMVVVAVTILVALQQYFHIAYSTGMRIRSGVLGTVYAKVSVGLMYVGGGDGGGL